MIATVTLYAVGQIAWVVLTITIVGVVLFFAYSTKPRDVKKEVLRLDRDIKDLKSQVARLAEKIEALVDGRE